MPQEDLGIPVIVSADENGIYDGREIARQLIQTAFQALVPYVNCCPGCADALFSAIANDTLTELHQQGRKAGSLGYKIWATAKLEAESDANEEAGMQASERHLEAAYSRTREMLERHRPIEGHRH